MDAVLRKAWQKGAGHYSISGEPDFSSRYRHGHILYATVEEVGQDENKGKS
jgi:hypothetical protein